MADIASQLLEFPPEGKQLSSEEYDKRITHFLKSTISNLSTNKVNAADADQDLLQIIDPSVNSLSYLYVLKLRIEGAGKSKTPHSNDTAATFKRVLEFLTKFDGTQMRYAGPEIRGLMEFAIQTAPRTNVVPDIIAAIRTAIFRLDPTAGTLTSTHLLFLRLCLQARSFQEAVPLLRYTVYSFPASKASAIDGPFLSSPHTDSTGYINESSGITAKITSADVHEYFLLSALIWIGLRQWEEALLNLELVLTSPTQGTPSALMLEAYQKWLIVGCLIHGRSVESPKTISGGVMRALKACSKAYDTLAEVFTAGDAHRLQAEITQGTLEWSADGNLGLVQQLLVYLPRFQLLNLQKTYSAIPLSTVANWLNQQPDNTHAFVEGLISTKALNASIELRDGVGQEAVLRFFPNQGSGPLAKSEKEYSSELVEQAGRTNAMVDYVRMADRKLVLTKEYVDGLRKRMRNKDEDGPVSLEGMDPAWDASGYQDEDIMLES